MIANPPIAKHHGSVLVISLLILLVLTILGVTALDTTVMEERMSSNTRQSNLARQAAETALKGAEKWLTNAAGNLVNQGDISKFSGTTELYDSTISSKSLAWDTNDSNAWDTTNSRAVTLLSEFPADATIVPGAPRYLIEYVGRVGDPPLNFTDPDLRPYAFRVIAIGWGTDKSTKVVLSTTYNKRLS